MTSLTVSFLKTKFNNPFILPSGIIQEIPQHLKAQTAGAGGITTKSLTLLPREGNPQPRLVKYQSGYLNSVGLRNPGLTQGIKQIKQLIKTSHVPVIVSIFAVKIDEFQHLAEAVAKIKPAFIELNLSCPNTLDELGQPLGIGSHTTYQVVSSIKKVVSPQVKLIAKLSPNVIDIAEIAKAAEAAGAAAISAINTVGPGMVIDLKTKKPVLGNKEGGVSGPGIKPIAIRSVYKIYETVKLPIIGMGGITTWQDAIEMHLAGATLVGLGSAVYLKGFSIFNEISQGVRQFLKENRYQSIKELVGLAHQ